MSAYCKPCLDKGHQCDARDGSELEDGIPRCIFCEDGEACPRANHVETHKPLLRGDLVKPRRTREDALQVSGPRHPRRRAAKVETTEATRMNVSGKVCGRPGCGKALTERNQSGFCAADFYLSKKKTDRVNHKRTGLDDGPPLPVRRGRPPKSEKRRAKSAGKSNSGGNGHAVAVPDSQFIAIRVNERQLNDFIFKLPLEQRAAMVNAWLAGAD